MSEVIQARLKELRDELAAGEEQMEAIERRRMQLRDTMLRISGAIQVLEELSTSSTQEAAETEAQQA